jgi:hypothetical protein
MRWSPSAQVSSSVSRICGGRTCSGSTTTKNPVRDLVDGVDGYMEWRATGKTSYVDTDPWRIMESYAGNLLNAMSYVLRYFDTGQFGVQLDAETHARVNATLHSRRQRASH